MEIKYCEQFIFCVDRFPIKPNESKLNFVSVALQVLNSESNSCNYVYHAPPRETNKIKNIKNKKNKQIQTGLARAHNQARTCTHRHVHTQMRMRERTHTHTKVHSGGNNHI